MRTNTKGNSSLPPTMLLFPCSCSPPPAPPLRRRYSVVPGHRGFLLRPAPLGLRLRVAPGRHRLPAILAANDRVVARRKIRTGGLRISDGGNMAFSFAIVDKKMKTRTCITTLPHRANLLMVPSDLSISSLSDALEDVNMLFLDGYSHEMALVVAKHVPCALLETLIQFPCAKFVIVARGGNGCTMLQRSAGDDSGIDAAYIEKVTESLKLELHKDDILPTCVLSKRAWDSIWKTAELVDTSGCGLWGSFMDYPPGCRRKDAAICLPSGKHSYLLLWRCN